jgi:hypothetical protein
MDISKFRRVALAVLLASAVAGPAFAQSTPTKLQGIIHANVTSGGSVWVVAGDWLLTLKGNSGKADFFASLAMSQSGAAPGSPHTHHVSLSDATVTALGTGYSITGNAAITGNGTLTGLSGSAITIEVTGGSDLPQSNIRLIFQGTAAGHFGTDPVNGVVVYR